MIRLRGKVAPVTATARVIAAPVSVAKTVTFRKIRAVHAIHRRGIN